MLTGLVSRLWEWVQWLLQIVLAAGKIPKHVAFIMDGNRRYARRLQVDTALGHTAGWSKVGDASHGPPDASDSMSLGADAFDCISRGFLNAHCTWTCLQARCISTRLRL